MQDTPPETAVRLPTRRRRYSDDYKRRILDELDACTQFGQKATLLRREGLYDSSVSRWRKQMGRDGTRRGRPRKDPRDIEIERLRFEKQQLERALQRAEFAIGVQKKLCELLEISSPDPSSDSSSSTP